MTENNARRKEEEEMLERMQCDESREILGDRYRE